MMKKRRNEDKYNEEKKEWRWVLMKKRRNKDDYNEEKKEWRWVWWRKAGMKISMMKKRRN